MKSRNIYHWLLFWFCFLFLAGCQSTFNKSIFALGRLPAGYDPATETRNDVAFRGGNWSDASRYLQDERLLPLIAATGRLVVIDATGRANYCTAFLVSKDRLTSARHCFKDPPQPIRGAVVEFGDFRKSQELHVYEVSIDPIAVNRERDLSVHFVNGQPGNYHGFLRISDKQLLPGKPIVIAHHPYGGRLTLSKSNCSATLRDAISVLHSCDTAPGSSGAPMATLDGEVFAVHSGGNFAHNRGFLTKAIRDRDFSEATESAAPERFANSAIELARRRNRLRSARQQTADRDDGRNAQQADTPVSRGIEANQTTGSPDVTGRQNSGGGAANSQPVSRGIDAGNGTVDSQNGIGP